MSTLADALPGSRPDLPTGTPALVLDDVGLAFGGVQALSGVSFEVANDELFAIIGPNGAGKTSLFNCISTFYRPQTGSIEVLGRPVGKERTTSVSRRGLARMFQNIALFDTLTVLDNLMLGRHPHVRYGVASAFVWRGRARREEAEHRAVCEEIVDFLEIEAYRRQPVGALPLGVKKRVELGRALASEPKLMLLDEPVAGMNAQETEDMARFVTDIRRELGIPLLLVEHDMGLVMDLADRVLVLDFGQVVACATPREVQEDPNVIRAYLGQEHETA